MTKETSPTFLLEQQVATLEQHVAELQQAVIDLAAHLDDHLMKLPGDVEHAPVFIVIEDSPAWEAFKRACGRGQLKPGNVVPIRRSEFESLKTDLLAIQIAEKSD